MKEFTSAAELHAHYREVFSRRPPFERAMPPVAVQPEPEPPPPEPEPPRPVKPLPARPLHRMARIVAEHYGIGWEHISGPARLPALVRVRHVFCFVCRRVLYESLPRIGHILRRDHTTVLHGELKIEEMLQTDQTLAQDIEQITARYREKT